jgi:hypothetical protein
MNVTYINVTEGGHTVTLILCILLVTTATHLGDPSRTIRGMLGAKRLYSSLESSQRSRSKMCAVKCCNTHSSGEAMQETVRMSVCGLTSLKVGGGTEGKHGTHEGIYLTAHVRRF